MISKFLTTISHTLYGTGIGNYPVFKQLYPYVMKKIDRKSGVYPTKFGFKMTLTQFNIVDHSIIQYGVREPYITDLLFKYLQPGDIFLDIGANIGYDTLLACKIVGEGGKVFSIEPNSRIYAELEKNIALNKEILPIEHIQTFKVGAGKTKTTFESHYAEGNPGGSSLIETKGNKNFQKETVNVDRLDDILPTHTINFIKMDIEGFEREAIQGMPEILKSVKYMIFEYSPGMKQYDHNLLDHLAHLGFDLFHIEENAELTLIDSTKRYCEKIIKKGQSDIMAIRK